MADIYRPVCSGERLYQGEILENIVEWVPTYSETDPRSIVEVSPRLRKYVVVLTQDCDLAQDWARRASATQQETDLPHVVLCPAGEAEQRFDADGITGNDRRKPIRNNKNERYQYLADVPSHLDGLRRGFSALLIDFKSIFAIRTVELYRQLGLNGEDAARRRFRLTTPWAEHLQCRFASYHSRIALPRDHFVPEARRQPALGQ